MEPRKALVVMSGGMDSTIAARVAVGEFGSENVHAISFNYGQKQYRELEMASLSSLRLGIRHTVLDMRFLGDIVRSCTANIIGGKHMPTIAEILGEPQPVTYVPNRNSIMLMLAAAYSEANGIETIYAGLQAQDEYSYWDTTQTFVEAINGVLNLNRKNSIKIVAPFAGMNKTDEIKLLLNLDGNVELLKTTLTCYSPDVEGLSCGVCPSCSERIRAFKNVGIPDPVGYSIKINW